MFAVCCYKAYINCTTDLMVRNDKTILKKIRVSEKEENVMKKGEEKGKVQQMADLRGKTKVNDVRNFVVKDPKRK